MVEGKNQLLIERTIKPLMSEILKIYVLKKVVPFVRVLKWRLFFVTFMNVFFHQLNVIINIKTYLKKRKIL